jgi:phosphatidylglycerol:prolipoprotein diacylglycerol transferase
MHPILIELGPLKIHTFGAIVAIGVIVAAFLSRWEANRRGMDGDLVLDICVKTALIGFLGSRLMYVALNFDYFAKNPLDVLAIWKGGLVWYGGFLTAFAFALWSFKRHGLPVGSAADTLAPAVILGLAIGRVGCLMAGDDYGKIIPLEPGEKAPWYALTFPDPPDPILNEAGKPIANPRAPLMEPEFRGKPLYPTQPLMTLLGVTVFGILFALRKRLAPYPGAIAALLLVLYPIKRFPIEMLRGDKVRGFLIPGVLSTSQAVSIPVLIIGLAVFLHILKKGPRRAPEAGAA